MARLLRFLHIEPRKSEPETPAGDGCSALRPPPVAGEALSFAEIERLRKERRDRFASGMEIADQPAESQPFLRCAVCEADNGRFAERCTNCGAALTTPEQRAYNDALWEQSRAYNQAVEAARPEVPSSGTRAYGEELARQVGRSEHARLEWMRERRPSPGTRILGALPQRARNAAILGGLAEIAGTGIAAYSTHEATWRFAFFASVALIGALFVPRRR
jgi:hypothetical protein